MEQRERQGQPMCPHCGAGAFCLGRDCGAGMYYYDYFLLWCTACGHVKASIERGGDTMGDNWLNSCPYCGAADNGHGDTPPDDVVALAAENPEGVLRAGNPEMKAPKCSNCGLCMMCRTEQERDYDEDRFYDNFYAGCPNCGHAEASYDSVSTDNAVSLPCPFCGSQKFGEHYGNVKGEWPKVNYRSRFCGVLAEGDIGKKLECPPAPAA